MAVSGVVRVLGSILLDLIYSGFQKICWVGNSDWNEVCYCYTKAQHFIWHPVGWYYW